MCPHSIYFELVSSIYDTCTCIRYQMSGENVALQSYLKYFKVDYSQRIGGGWELLFVTLYRHTVDLDI